MIDHPPDDDLIIADDQTLSSPVYVGQSDLVTSRLAYINYDFPRRPGSNFGPRT